MDIINIPYQLFYLGILLLSALLMGKLFARIGVGEITGQIIGGMLVNPYFLIQLGFVSKECQQAFSSFKFLMFAVFTLIVFGLGEEMHIERIRKAGRDILIISFIQITGTFTLIFILFFLAGIPLINALIIGTVGVATAPAALFILIKRMGIEGDLRYKTTNIVVLSNVIQIVMFSVFMQIALDMETGKVLIPVNIMVVTLKEISLAAGIGIIIFCILRFAVKDAKFETIPAISSEKTGLGFLRFVFEDTPTPSLEIFLLILGLICVGSAISWNLGLPFLITSLVAGMLVANFHTRRVFDSLFIGNITTLFNLIFFALIGASLRFDTYNITILLFVILYVFSRGAGMFFGTMIGCKITRQDLKISKCMPMLMLPQAGLAAVQVAFIGMTLSKGEFIFQTVIPAMIIFEVGGILSSENALKRWKSWVVGEERILKGKEVLQKEGTLLNSALKEHNIKVPLTGTNKIEVLNEMLECLVDSGEIDKKLKNSLFKEVVQREKIQTTGIGDGIAIPHIRNEMVNKIVCALGIKKDEGVHFKSIDKKPVNIVFLFLSPEKETINHLKLLSEISFILRKKENRELLKNMTNRKEAYNFLRNIKI
ncbi:MAG: PTS sugar transporter subunit IIA [Thermodesulfobacteriota bacterium]|nr:PTS sugar transporter subunit IIA [Thermodesulfobacteriota bacterium]